MGGKGGNYNISLKLCGGLHPKLHLRLVVRENKKIIRTPAAPVPLLCLAFPLQVSAITQWMRCTAEPTATSAALL